ncbi:MAG: Gfo/Idh/MocA family oxidoreductase [bacterium]|nr:Gfo/Idh/MocA family oxidoreductase [bacterium]
MTEKKEMKRRRFMQQTAGSAIALSALNGIMPSSVLGANERINAGIIGPGGRGRGIMREFMHFGSRFIAVCDVFEENLNRGMEIAGEGATAYDDYRKLLENKDIDAVVIASPEHQHGVQLIDTVNAGKDSYCEKPMSHSIEEGNKMVQAVRATDRIVQIGMQRRSSPAVHEAKKIVDEGKLGNVHLVKAQWNWNYSSPMNYGPLDAKLNWEAFCYPSPVAKFEVARFRNWRVFWDYSGGHVCDQGTHLMDVIQWFMNSGTPQMAECFGRVYKMTGAETPDVFTAMFEYANFNATWELSYTNRFQDGWTITFQGDKGTLVLNDQGSRYYSDETSQGWPKDIKPDWEFSGPLPTLPHVENFLECVKSRKEPNAPVEVGHRAVCGPHLANVAWHNKKRAYLNEDATQVTV